MSRSRSIYSNNILYSGGFLSPDTAATVVNRTISKTRHSHKYNPGLTGAGLLNSSYVMLRHSFLSVTPAPVSKFTVSKNINGTYCTVHTVRLLIQREGSFFRADGTSAPRPVLGYPTDAHCHPRPFGTIHHPSGSCKTPKKFAPVEYGSPRRLQNYWAGTVRLITRPPFMTRPIPFFGPFQVSPQRITAASSTGARCFQSQIWYLCNLLTTATAPVSFAHFVFSHFPSLARGIPVVYQL